MDRNDSGGLYAGGAVVVVIVLVACLKAIKRLFIEMGHTFDAFAYMAKSLIALLFQFAIDMGLLACAIAAIYFTYRYVMMVRRATALREEVDRRLSDFGFEFRSTLRSALSELDESVDARIRYMERELYEALKEPEAAPVPVVTTQPEIEVLRPAQSEQTTDQSSSQSNEVTDLTAISNPY